MNDTMKFCAQMLTRLKTTHRQNANSAHGAYFAFYYHTSRLKTQNPLLKTLLTVTKKKCLFLNFKQIF